MRRFIVAAVLVSACIVAAGCGGGPSQEEITAKRVALGQALADELKSRDLEHLKAKAQERAQVCRSRIGNLVEALHDIDSRLDVGMSYDEYSDALGDAAVQRGRMDDTSVGGRICERAATAAETAFNSYNRGARTWNDCVFDTSYSLYDLSCTFDDIDYEMQNYWATASRKVDAAIRSLKKVGTYNSASLPHYRTSPPRVEYEVGSTIFGAALTRLCVTGAPSSIIEPCDDLRDVLSGGVEPDEESRLNEALLGITEAYAITPPHYREKDSE